MPNPEGNILPFPTKRKAAYRNPPGWWNGPLPSNVSLIRPPIRLPPTKPLEPAAYLILAILEALRTEPRTWARTGGPDVLGRLQDMSERWGEDEQVQLRVQEALRILLSRRTGRV